MAKRIIEIDSGDRGLWVNGSKDTAPNGALRRARGLHSVRTNTIRSRFSDSTVSNIGGAIALYRFDDVRYQATASALYRNSGLIASGAQDRPSFMRMPPTASVVDYLFVANGIVTRKIDAAGNVTNWGIAPPPDGFTATKGSQLVKTIDDFQTAAGWTTVNCSVSDEATIKQFGTNSMQVDVAANTMASVTKALTLDLTDFSGTLSPIEDFIELWLRVDNPQNVNFVDIQFDVSGAAFNTDFYQYRVFGQTNPLVASQNFEQTKGLGDVPGLGSTDDFGTAVDVIAFGGVQSSFNFFGDLLESAQPDFLETPGAWTRLRIPKKLFPKGGASSNDWSDVAALRLIISTNAGTAGTTVYFDRARLVGSVGMQGTYKYAVTFRNSVTGTRSNANATPVTITNVERQFVTLASLPVSADSQVNQREIWRTYGGGAIYFRAAVINDNTTTTFEDHVADYIGLNSASGVDTLENVQLPDDNLVPQVTTGDTWGPYAGRAWWCRDSAAGAGGRVYYSPAGRAEAVQGFVDVTNDDDPTQKGITWNGANWVFTESKLFKIEGTNEPFLSREVFGVPGTSQPHTVIATPFGIIYQSYDGIRAFNGTSAPLVAPEPVQVLFRGEASENLTAFEGVVASYINNEYIISDGTQTLAVNLQTGVWRDLGTGYSALYTEQDTGLLIGAKGSTTVQVESESSIDDVTFDIETPSQNFGIVPTLVETIYVDATVTQATSVYLIQDQQAVSIGNLAAGSRQVNIFQLDEMSRLCGLRISGTVNPLDIIHNIKFQVRDIPLILQINGKIATGLEGELQNLTTGIFYRGLDNVISLTNAIQVPHIRRLYIDCKGRDNAITPRFTFYSSVLTMPPIVVVGQERRIIAWDVVTSDRLVSLELLGDFTISALYQVVLDVQIGEV